MCQFLMADPVDNVLLLIENYVLDGFVIYSEKVTKFFSVDLTVTT